jgi:protein TonB
MAPAVKIEGKQPATLPADFGAWDSGEHPETLPDNFDDFDAAPKPPTKPSTPQATKPVTAQATVSHVVGGLPVTTALRKPATVYAEELSEPLQPNRANIVGGQKRKIEGKIEGKSERKIEARSEDKSEGKSKHKMMVVFVSIGAVLLLVLLILIPLHYHKSPPKTAMLSQAVVPEPATASLTPPTTTKPKPPPTPTPPPEAVPTPHVQSEMMNNQLNAPSRISIKTTPDKDAPPSSGFGATGMEGLSGNSGGAVGSVFSGKTGPRVTAEISKMLNVSGGVMAGRVISKTSPVYPPLARTARVAGTVVLHASISKTGMIENLNVISGPAMLRQSALDAVKTWRYRPYLLNNEPVEVETTVNVIFALGG